MKNLFSFLLLTLLLTSSAWAQKKVAIVKLLKGEVDVLTLGKTMKLKVEDWVEEGAVVKTAEKSFVKLVFIDKSQMNIGPGSEMKIEKFGDKDSGVIDLVKGKIRSQVTKDYLQMDRNKSKLFIKTANAVMGVRGTDFLISTNGQTTSTVLFEGAISFNKLDNRGETNSNRLEDIVDRGVNIQPGEFSVADKVHPLPTVPAVLNVGQREALEKNETFDADRAPGNSSAKVQEKSIVPPGLTGDAVSNDTSALKTEIAKAGSVAPVANGSAQGFETAEQVKPTNGAFLHVDSGVIIAPPPGSVFDPITNTYIASGSAGTVSSTGEYIPPKNVEITANGTILVASVDASGKTVVTETAAPSAVTDTKTVLGTAPANTFQPAPTLTSPTYTRPTANMEAPLIPNKYDVGYQATQDVKTNNQTEQSTTTRTTITTTGSP
ncbi:MAG: FecR family protein [Bdellovibrionota bacterium]